MIRSLLDAVSDYRNEKSVFTFSPRTNLDPAEIEHEYFSEPVSAKGPPANSGQRLNLRSGYS